MSADTNLMPIPGAVDPVPVRRSAPARADGRQELVGLSKDQIRAALESVRFRKYRDLVRRQLVCRLLERWPGPADRFDIVHSHFGPMGLLASALRHAGRSRAALVTTFHGVDISETVDRYGPRYYAPLFAVGDRFLGVSQYWANSLRSMGAPADRIRVQHMGVDCDKLTFRPRSREGRAHTQLLSIGRLTEKKGHEYTLRALAQLRTQAPELDVRLDIVGGGPLRAQLLALRAELGLEQKVQLHDSLPHARVVELLEQADLFVLPSVTARSGDMEGIPVSVRKNLGAFTQPISYVGLPVVAAPVNRPGQLPIGVQIIAPAWREDLAFAAALRLQHDGVVAAHAPKGAP